MYYAHSLHRSRDSYLDDSSYTTIVEMYELEPVRSVQSIVKIIRLEKCNSRDVGEQRWLGRRKSRFEKSERNRVCITYEQSGRTSHVRLVPLTTKLRKEEKRFWESARDADVT